MARNNGNRSNGSNDAEVRVLFIEAKNINGDLTGLAQAIASAVRQAPPPPQSQNMARALGDGNGRPAQLSTPLEEDDDDTVEMVVVTPPAQKQSRDRKPFKGVILDDIAWDGGGTPFLEYVKRKDPQDTMKRYLVASAWFKRHGGHESVNTNLIYNAYRKAGWGLLNDLNQPLRDGAKTRRGYYLSDGKGNYTITNIGLDIVDGLGEEGA